MSMLGGVSCCTRCDDDFDARVVFVAKRAVHRRRVFEPDAMRDDEGGVNLAALDSDQSCSLQK
jgi:hypothetical protein